MINWLRTQSLTFIVSLVLSAIILAGLSVNAWITYHLVNTGERKLILAKFQTEDAISTQLFETYFQLQQREIENISQEITKFEHDWNTTGHFPAGLLNHFLSFEPENLVALSARKNKIFSHELSDSEQQRFIQQLDSLNIDPNEKKPYWHAYIEETGKTYLFYIYQREAHTEASITTLILRLRLANLEFFQPEQYLLAKTGEVLTPHHQQQDFATKSAVIAQHTGQIGMVSIPTGHALFSPIGDTELTLVHLIPETAVQNLATPLLHTLIQVWIVIFGSILLLHYYLLNKLLIHPLQSFVRLLEALKPTALKQRLPALGFKEPEQVRTVFNRLLDTLLSYQNELEDKITERTKALDIAKKQAELANARKSLHLSSVSHELRTPLNGILGQLQLLQVDNEATAAQQQRLAHAKKSSLDLLELVENLLDFSRIERGELKITTDTFDLYPFLEHIGTTLAPLAEQKHLSLHVIIGRHVPMHIETDRARLKQILLNLLGNSLKFTEQGQIRLSVFTSVHALHFSVLDTGKGMDKSALRDIFQPFVQLDEALSGIGLGLNISQQLAEKMGGRLRVRSKKNAYTCFCLSLPLHTGQKAQHTFEALTVKTQLPLQRQLRCWGVKISKDGAQNLDDPALTYTPQNLYQTLHAFQNPNLKTTQAMTTEHTQSPWQLKILVVDDVAMNTDIATQMLEKLGHQTYSADSGQKALLFGTEFIFDLVLLDMRMPKMSGLDVLKQWRERADILDPDCFIALLTANSLPEEEVRAKHADVNAYLIKPIDWEKLQATTQAVCDYQLDRGVDLIANPNRKAPVFDITQAAIWEALHKELVALEKQLKDTQSTQDKENIVHKIAGLLGHAGLHEFCQTAQSYEQQLHQGMDIPIAAIVDLIACIKAYKP